MNINEFAELYREFKDADDIAIECEHPDCNNRNVLVSKVAAKRNIKKNGKYICRSCFLKFNNPLTSKVPIRKPEQGPIIVSCDHPDHEGPRQREMSRSSYFGPAKEPFVQMCKSCAQRGKSISAEQKQKISNTLSGRQLTESHKQKISEYMKNSEEGIERGKKNLIAGFSGGWNKGQSTPDEVKAKQSAAMLGKKKTLDHRVNISEGRKKMLEETGGFTQEHRDNIRKATLNQYEKGFDPKGWHLRGYHDSPKAGRVFFRSSYEKKAYMILDNDPTVVTYEVESVAIQYHHPIKGGDAFYLIDLLVKYEDGSTSYIEVKPKKLLQSPVVIAKLDAAKMEAERKAVRFEVMTEYDLFGDKPYVKEIRFRRELKQEIEQQEVDPEDF